MLEISLPLAVFFFYVWVLKLQASLLITILVYLFCIFSMVIPFFIHKERPSELGIRLDNFPRAFLETGIILSLLLVVIVTLNRHYQFPRWPILLNHTVYWVFWGILQQFIIQSFFYLRLNRTLKNRYLSIFGAAIIFSLIHALNFSLMILTFFGGLILSYLFSRNRNIFSLGICHGIVSIFIQAYLCPWIVPSFGIGPREPLMNTAYVAYGKGIKVVAGDVTGDGKIEIVTGKGPHSENDSLIKVFDCQGNKLSSFFAFDEEIRYGVNLALGDVNGDGKDEIIAGAGISPDNKAIVRVLDWKGNIISSFRAFNFWEEYGVRVAAIFRIFNSWKDCGVNVAAGDIDGDGKDEIIAGTAPGLNCLPEVRIFTADGKEIRRFFPFDKEIKQDGKMKHGLNVSCGNILGDKRVELVVGYSHLSPGYLPDFKILDSQGKELKYFTVYKGGGYGLTLNTGDINGDGYDEVITGPGPHKLNPTHLKVIDGELNTLFSFIVYPDNRYVYGLNVAAGDVDGDGKDELITGLGSGPEYPSEVSILKPTGKHSFKVLHRFNAY